LRIETETGLRSKKLINFKISAIFIVLLVLLVCLFLALNKVAAQEKTISLVVNGLGTTQTTRQQTIGGLIDEIYQNQEEIISVFPTLEKELSTGDTIFIKVSSTTINPTVAVNLKEAIKKANEPSPAPAVLSPVSNPESLKSRQETPAQQEEAMSQREPKSLTYLGTATWYQWGDKLTTASTQFPRGSKLRVIAINSGKTVDVIVNDYGPETWTGVALDLNSIAFSKLAPLGAGKIPIKYYLI